MTEEKRLLKEEAYEFPSRRNTTVTSGWYWIPFLLHSLTHAVQARLLQIAGGKGAETAMALPH